METSNSSNSRSSSFASIEAPQTPARCSPFQNGGRGRIPGETWTFSFRSCEKITIWWECRHCGLCDFPIAADKPPSCTIWQVQRSRALYISCSSFVRKCRRVWNKPWPSCNFCAEECYLCHRDLIVDQILQLLLWNNEFRSSCGTAPPFWKGEHLTGVCGASMDAKDWTESSMNLKFPWIRDFRTMNLIVREMQWFDEYKASTNSRFR